MEGAAKAPRTVNSGPAPEPLTAEDSGPPFNPVINKKKEKAKAKKGGKSAQASDTAPLTAYNFTREAEKSAFRPGGKVARSPLRDARGFVGERVLTQDD